MIDKFTALVLARPGSWYLGIDPSLTATGLAAIHSDGTAIVHTMQPTKGFSDMERLAWFDAGFAALFSLSWSGCMIEGYSFASKFSRAHALGELGGIIRLSAHRHKQGLWELPPKSLCMFLTGSGNADKSIRTKEVFKKWNIDTMNDNEADAVVLAKAVKALLDRSFTHTYQIDAADKATVVCRAPVVSAVPVRVRKRV